MCPCRLTITMILKIRSKGKFSLCNLLNIIVNNVEFFKENLISLLVNCYKRRWLTLCTQLALSLNYATAFHIRVSN